MHKNAHGMRRTYKAGCRCDQCKQAESAYKRDLRRRHREAVGEVVTGAAPSLSLVTGSGAEFLTSENTVTAAVSLEISGIGAHLRPGLAAAAIALARVLDNPKAVSTQPAAAAKLSDLLKQFRKNSSGRQSKLAAVRSLTSANAATLPANTTACRRVVPEPTGFQGSGGRRRERRYVGARAPPPPVEWGR